MAHIGRKLIEGAWGPRSLQVWVNRAALAAIIAGVLLVAAEFLDLFHVSAAGHSASGTSRTGGDNHGYALLVVGLMAIVAALGARASEEWYAGAALAALGVLALAVVLIGDLPDATSAGVTIRLQAGQASPAIGFWVELVGAVALAGSGGALVYLRRVTRASP
jgi:hypothetical protein